MRQPSLSTASAMASRFGRYLSFRRNQSAAMCLDNRNASAPPATPATRMIGAAPIPKEAPAATMRIVRGKTTSAASTKNSPRAAPDVAERSPHRWKASMMWSVISNCVRPAQLRPIAIISDFSPIGRGSTQPMEPSTWLSRVRRWRAPFHTNPLSDLSLAIKERSSLRR